jgi:protein MAK16
MVIKVFWILIYNKKIIKNMKTKVEINGYEIEVEFIDGVITVKAEKDDEVIEEFTIQTEGGDGEDNKEVRPFGDFDEEDDFEGQDDDFEGQDDDFEDGDGEDEFEDDGEDEEEKMNPALESFQSFINKKRK